MGEEENEDYAIQTNRNFLKMKYQGRVDKDKISYNLLDSLASYAVEANVYKQLQQNASRLLGAKNLLEQNKGTTNMSKQVSSYIDMIYYNEYDKGGATVKNRMFNKIINSMRGSSAFFMLAAKPINDLKNIMSGVTFGMLYSNNRWYTKWDYFQSLSTTKEILLSHFKDKLRQGNKTDLGMKIQYFNIIQGDYFSIRSNKADKEFLLGQYKDKKGSLFPKKWEPIFHGGEVEESPFERSQEPPKPKARF